MQAATRVTKHLRAIPQQTWRWLPTCAQTRGQQFIRTRLMIPDSDRRHSAVSGRVINQHEAIAPRHHDVERVFILRNNVGN